MKPQEQRVGFVFASIFLNEFSRIFDQNIQAPRASTAVPITAAACACAPRPRAAVRGGGEVDVKLAGRSQFNRPSARAPATHTRLGCALCACRLHSASQARLLHTHTQVIAASAGPGAPRSCAGLASDPATVADLEVPAEYLQLTTIALVETANRRGGAVFVAELG